MLNNEQYVARITILINIVLDLHRGFDDPTTARGRSDTENHFKSLIIRAETHETKD